MIKRYGALLAVAVLFIASDAVACRSYLGSPTAATDVTTFKDNLNVDLADYGVIYEEAAPWSACTQAAADALYKKLYTTFYPTVVGKPGFPRYSNQIEGPYNQFQGWLAGGDAALIQATALRLANVGKLSKPLDALVQRVSNIYAFKRDKNCGFDGTVPDYSNPPNTLVRWTTQNSCMEDYTIGAMGLAWTAAYRSKRGLGNYTTPAAAARTAMTDALSVDSSICAWNQSNTNVNPAPARGPCTGSMSDLLNNSNFLPISLHGGDSMPYGVGLFTSLAGAAVGLEVANGQQVTLSTTEQAVVQKLYLHARNYTASDHSSFDTDCWRFTLENGALKATANFMCRDENTPYHPKMFPIRDFVAKYAPPSQSNPGFDTIDRSLFCDTANGTGIWGGCDFYNPGRRAVYGDFGQTWVQNPPIFSNTGLGDYTVTLRTYNGNYVSAANGGGSSVNAAPTTAGGFEQFSLMNRTDTTLSDGDTVTLQTMATGDKGQWFVAEDGGGTGSVLKANRLYPWSWETFTIHKLNGTGNINSGDTIALTSILGYYVSATNGGGSTVLVDKTAAITWEAFTINLTHN
jgi:hypothetical protein